MTRRLNAVSILLLLASAGYSPGAEKKVLVYTRNYVTGGGGYVHENISTSVAAVRKMGQEKGFAVDVSDDPVVFTDSNLRQYLAIVFSNSNNEAFACDEQRGAFQRYIRAGGGFVGIHSASGSERQWPYFWSILGGRFLRHPKFQKFVVKVADRSHPATRELPLEFEWEDECYYHDNVSPELRPLLVTDPAGLDDPQKSIYPGDRFGDALPLAWYQEREGGRQFYTSLGHSKEAYGNPIFYRHVLGGILWAMKEE